MRVVCLGDSLALPREGCNYSDTWIAKLKSEFSSVDFVCDFRGGMLVDDLLESWSYLKHVKADTAIIQEGICDCAPRYVNDKKLFWKVLLLLIKKIGIDGLFWRMVKHGTRKPQCTYTSLTKYINRFNEIVKEMFESGVSRVIILKIGHGAPSIISKSQYFNSNVDAYNRTFDHLQARYGDNLIILDPLNQVDEDMFVDGYHCNAKGMDTVYHDLREVLYSNI